MKSRAGDLINSLSELAGQVVARRMQSYRLTHTGWRILFALARNNGAFQSGLAAELALGKVNVGSAIRKLEATGWVVRKLEPHDGRLRRVFLTRKSWAALQDIGDVRKEVGEKLLADMPLHGRKDLIDLLERMRRNLLPMMIEEGDEPSECGDKELPDGLDAWLIAAQQLEGSCEPGVEPRFATLTLGVADVQRSRRFYERAFGWRAADESTDSLVFFELGTIKLVLFERTRLAEDAGLPLGRGFGGIALAHTVRTREDVDAVLAQVKSARGRIIKPAQDVFWGGYSGYFADPDGHPWEVAYCETPLRLVADRIDRGKALELV